MVKAAKLRKTGQLILQGQIDERRPVIRNGLMAHYPFDYTVEPLEVINAPLTSAKVKDHDDFFLPRDAPLFSEENGITLSGNSTCYMRSTVTDSVGQINKYETIDVEISFNPSALGNVAICSQYSGYSHASRRAFTLRLNTDGKITAKVGAWRKEPQEANPTGWELTATSISVVPINQWTKVRLGYDTKNLTLYINDKLEATVPALPDTTINGVVHKNNLLTSTAGGGMQNCVFIGADGAYTETASQVTNATNDPVARVPGWEGFNNFKGSLRDLKIYKAAVPIISNTSYSNKGIAIEPATTNLLDPIKSTWVPWNAVVGASAAYINAEGRPGANVKVETNIPSSGVCYYETGGQKTAKPSTVYTVSATIKYNGFAPSPNLFYLRQYKTDGTQISEFGLYSSANSIDLGNGWKRVYATFTTNSLCARLLIHGYEYNEKEIWIEDIQCEERGYHTSYVNGSNGTGGMTVPFPIGTSDFTVTGEFTPNANSDDLSGSCYFIDLGGGFTLYTYITTKQPYIPGNTIAGGLPNHNVHQTFNLLANVKVRYFITRNGTTFTWRIKSEDGREMTWVKAHERVPLINVSSIFFSPTWGGKHQNISMYNRALSTAEQEKLISNKFSMTKQGDINNVQYQEIDEGWQLIYHGLASYALYGSSDAFVDDGVDIPFNEIKVTCPFWDYEVRSNTNKTARMTQPFSWYVKWVRSQPDLPNPRATFHGVDGVQDVTLTSNNILYGYGNGYRQFTPVHNVAGRDYLFTGSTPSYINKHDWYNTTDYKYQMDTDKWRESGRYNLTPKEYQTIQVWVRMKPTKDPAPMNTSKNQLKAKNLLEGQKNLDL